MAQAPYTPDWKAALTAARDAARCGAQTRSGRLCQGPAMPNGRCRMHGGKSTGPRTEAGKARSRQAALRHGYYTAEAREERRRAHAERAQTIALIRMLERLGPEAVQTLMRVGPL